MSCETRILLDQAVLEAQATVGKFAIALQTPVIDRITRAPIRDLTREAILRSQADFASDVVLENERLLSAHVEVCPICH